MSDRESQQASLDASEASLPAENGSREVANDPPPLGRAEESVSDKIARRYLKIHIKCHMKDGGSILPAAQTTRAKKGLFLYLCGEY